MLQKLCFWLYAAVSASCQVASAFVLKWSLPVPEFIEFTSTSLVVPASPSETWRVLTNETGSIFMGATFHTTWRQGDELVSEGEWDGNKYRDHGVLVTVKPDSQLQFTQFNSMSGKPDTAENYDLVTFDLLPEGEQTRVHLRLAKPVGVTPPGAEQVAALTKNLHLILDKLRNLLL